MDPLPPIDTPEQRRALLRHNRETDAKRAGWPDGVLQECERLDEVHPGWFVSWRVAGEFSAWRPEGPSLRKPSGGWMEPHVVGATVVELEEAIEAMDERITAELEEQERWRQWMSLRPR